MKVYQDNRHGAVAASPSDRETPFGQLSCWLVEALTWRLVDIPAWLGGYHCGLGRFGRDEARAIAHADDLVRRSEGAQLGDDGSPNEHGPLSSCQTDVLRLFTALGSYMAAKFDIAHDSGGADGKAGPTNRTMAAGGGMPGAFARQGIALAMDMTALFMADAVLAAAIKGQVPGGDKAENDAEAAGWAAFLAEHTGYSVMGALPLVRDAAGLLQGSDRTHGSIIGEAAKTILDLHDVATAASTGEDIEAPDIGAIIEATGLATGATATQLSRIVEVGLGQIQGQHVSPLEYLMGKSSRQLSRA